MAFPGIDDSIVPPYGEEGGSRMEHSKILSDEFEHLYIPETSGAHGRSTHATDGICRSVRIGLDGPSKIGPFSAGSFFYEIELRKSYSSSKCPRAFTQILVVVVSDNYPITILVSSVIIHIGIAVYELLSVLSITLRTARKASVCS